MWMHKKLFWGFPLGFLLQQYQPLVMLSLINFYKVRTDTVMQTFSIILSVLMIVVSVVVLPIVYVISRSFLKDDEGHSLRFGVLQNGYHYDNWISRHWNFLVLTRWLTVSVILVVLRDFYC